MSSSDILQNSTLSEPSQSHKKETASSENSKEVVENENPNRSEEEVENGCSSISSVVASHYNNVEEAGLDQRNKSRIVYLRNFNNWIKSMLISDYVHKCGSSKKELVVMDMCCGKGGDLIKWHKANISHLVCVDIAEVSVQQCKIRYDSLSDRTKDRSSKMMSAEFFVADCTREILKTKFKDPSMMLDVVSCQFSFHYCFESLPQAERMIQNASESLRVGGYFIGTIPDAYEIVTRLRKAGKSSFGNDVFQIKYHSEDINNIPLFGAKYDFYLEGVVNCPEFLVYFPVFLKLAEKYGFKLVRKQNFADYYQHRRHIGNRLLGFMQAFETYPPNRGESLQGKSEEYEHAEEYIKKRNLRHNTKIGTMSSNEWNAASLYLVFAFEKVKEIT